jgi:excisionase family DNA binding protein
VEAERTDYQETIDEALRIVYSHHHRLVTRLFPDAERPLNMDALRAGPLGRDLRILAQLARGEVREAKEIVLERIDSVLQLLFWPPMAEDYSVPRAFWESPLGRMMSMAKYRAYEPSELVSIGAAAQRLGVTRPTIYRWMDERHLGYVRDEMSGRTFVVQRDVDSLLSESQDGFAGLSQ